jgi:Transglycosylase-like domain
VRADGGIDHVLSRKTAFAAAGAALATVPVAVAAAQDPAPPAPAPAIAAGVRAAGLAGRAQAHVLRDGGLSERARRAHQKLVAQNIKLARKVAHARDHNLNPRHADRVRNFTGPRLRAENRTLHRKLHELQSAGGAASPQLEAIAACESGGDPHSIGGGGAFRGKYQFTYGTWASVGGKGDPAAAPEAEQDKRAQMLLDKSGSSPWPVCGQ